MTSFCDTIKHAQLICLLTAMLMN